MRLVAGTLLLALGACSGGADGDGPTPDAREWGMCDGGFLRCSPDLGCNLLENAGCDLGEKCAWVIIDSPNVLGTKSCVPDGDVPLGGACTWGPDGETSGFDDCVGGSVCIDGICEAVCTWSPDSCPDGAACALHTGIFTAETPALGTCEPLCDPVVQDCAAGACYGAFDQPFLCADVPAEVAAAPDSYAQEDPALTYSDGIARPNGCAPGFAPLLPPGDETLCIAYCSPVPTSAESPSGANGAVPHACADRGAPTQECRYFWFLESTAGGGPRHPDGVGFCWTPETYGAARCSTVSSTDPTYPTLGCAPFP